MYLKKIQTTHNNLAMTRRSLAVAVTFSLALLAGCSSGGSDSAVQEDEPLAPIAESNPADSDANDSDADNTTPQNTEVGSTGSEDSENSENPAAEVTPQINENIDIADIDDGDGEGEPADITDEDTSEASPPVEEPVNVETSPVGLLLDEIRLAVGDPLLTLSARLAGGELLDTDENNCLGSFDPAVGQQLTQIDCAADETSLTVYDSDLRLISGQFSDTAECQSAISEGNVNGCRLESASMLLPIVWIVAENPAPSQIGTPIPLQGAGFEYNLSADGILVIQDMTNLFRPFRCTINIDSGSLITTDATIGNCRSEVTRITGRLFDLREGNPPTGS